MNKTRLFSIHTHIHVFEYWVASAVIMGGRMEWENSHKGNQVRILTWNVGSAKRTFSVLYILSGYKTSGDAFRLPYSIAFYCSIRPFLDLFHSWLCISHLSRFFRGGLVFFLPSGFQLIMIFGSRVGSILSTWPCQMSCFRVISPYIVSCLFIFSLI